MGREGVISRDSDDYYRFMSLEPGAWSSEFGPLRHGMANVRLSAMSKNLAKKGDDLSIGSVSSGLVTTDNLPAQ
jgi:hypothetical protein